MDIVYRRTDEIASIAQEVREELHEGDIDLEQLSADEQSPDAPVIRLIQTMFQDAVQVRASDLHIEPAKTCCACANASTACCRNRRSTAAASPARWSRA